MLDYLLYQVLQVELGVFHHSERLVRSEFILDVVFVQRDQFGSQEPGDVVFQQFVLIELSSILLSHHLQQLLSLFSKGRNQEKESKILETSFLQSLARCGIEFFVVDISVEDCLGRLSSIERSLLMDEILDQEVVVVNFRLFEAFHVELLLSKFPGHDLQSHEVSPLMNQFHLVEDKVHFVSDLNRTVSLDLDILDHVSGFLRFSILLVHLAENSDSFCVFSLQVDFAIRELLQSVDHVVLLLSRGQSFVKSVEALLHHVSDGLLCLPSPL